MPRQAHAQQEAAPEVLEEEGTNRDLRGDDVMNLNIDMEGLNHDDVAPDNKHQG